MILKKLSKFIEANLTINDLSKRSDPKVTKYSPLRGDILLGKIENGEDIETIDGDSVKIDIDKEVDITDQYGKYDPSKSQNLKVGNLKNSKLKPIFSKIGDKSKKYKLSDLVKTSDFSGGGGSSLGTTETKVVETIQAHILSFKQEFYPNENLLLRHLNDSKNLERISNTKMVFGSLEITPDIIKNYKRYYTTFIRTSNRLISDRGILGSNRKYNFHQISSKSEFIVSLTNAYRKCCKNSFNKIINMAKWTPSDLWSVDSQLEGKFINEIDKLETMTDLNSFIDRNFGDSRNNRGIVGISLKKVSNFKENITIVINKITERPTFDLESIYLSTNDFTKGLEISIFRRSSKFPGINKMSVRSNTSGISNINIEILGSSSRHGKCSLSQINSILKSNGLNQVPLASEIKSNFDKDTLTREIIKISNKLKGLSMTELKNGRGQSEIFYPNLISKYQSLIFAEILINDKIMGGYKCDSCVNSIMYYALSIENQYFKCPRYARVVEY